MKMSSRTKEILAWVGAGSLWLIVSVLVIVLVFQ